MGNLSATWTWRSVAGLGLALVLMAFLAVAREGLEL